MQAKRGMFLASIIVLVTILVALAVIAIPAWRSHQTQVHVTGALQATDAAKLVVMETATVHGSLASIKADAFAYTPSVTTSAYVAKVSIANAGVIELTTKNTGALPDPTLVLIPASGTEGAASLITWTCTLATGNASAVPPACRAISPIRQAPPASAVTTGSSPR